MIFLSDDGYVVLASWTTGNIDYLAADKTGFL